MTSGVAQRYKAMVAAGQIESDPVQASAIGRLDALARVLEANPQATKGSALGWLFGRKSTAEPQRGLYIWGAVGRGKTMIMDLFFEELNLRRKRREHFHAFMSDVHERIYRWRQASRAGQVKGADPVAPVAHDLAREASVLCFDEFAVNDIADAMLLGRLFEALLAEGVTVVATSNRPPVDLYKDGLNRQLFLPFIDMIERRFEVVELASRTDYRLEKLAGAPVYLVPDDAMATATLDQTFGRLTGGMPPHPTHLVVKGRDVVLPRTAQGVAYCQFEELCDRPLGASDYLAIAGVCHTVLIAGVPVMGQDQRNAAKRFITLIDVFYDHGVKTVISAAAEPQALYRGTSGPEVFEFDRTVSRLIEMRSDEYLQRPHGRSRDMADDRTQGIVET